MSVIHKSFRVFLIAVITLSPQVLLSATIIAKTHSVNLAPVGRGQLQMTSRAHLPMAFEANGGQSDSRVRYLARGAGFMVYLTDLETVLSFGRYEHSNKKDPAKLVGRDVMRLSLEGGSRGVSLEAVDTLSGISNYFIGNDKTQWQKNIQQYSTVVAHEVYPGIDMVYYGTQGQLEYDFRVKPGADPAVIKLNHQGADSTSLDASGNLILTVGDRKLQFKAPSVYQEDADGMKTMLQGKYVVTGPNQVGFALGAYDKSKTLVIDPALDYSTFAGGSNQDQAMGIVVDSSGNAYVTGYTESTNFPTTSGAEQTVYGTDSFDYNAFVLKLNPAGTALIYSSYLGGSKSEKGLAIAVDSSGDAFVTGTASSTNFPITSGAYQTVLGATNSQNAFITEFNPNGTGLLYSTFLGGNDFDFGNAILLNGGNVYVVGNTESSTFPATSGAYQTSLDNSSNNNAFVSVLNPAGHGSSDLVYSTFLGGNGCGTGCSSNNYGDLGKGIAVNSSGNIYIVGTAQSSNFPITSGAYQTTLKGNRNAFMSVIHPAGAGSSDLLYSTYLGGSGNSTNYSFYADYGDAIAVDTSGKVYLTGYTFSSNFPTTSGAYQTTYKGTGTTSNAYLTAINPNGSGSADLLYSTYLGGTGGCTNGGETSNGLLMDGSGNVYLEGSTLSSDFPTTSTAYQRTLSGGSCIANAFVTMLNPGGNGTADMIYSTYIGNGEAQCYAEAIDTSGAVYIAGTTSYNTYPTTSGAFQTTLSGGYDSFVTKFDPADFVAVANTSTVTSTATATSTSTVTMTATATATNSATATSTNTATTTLTNTATNTASDTATNSATATSTNTATTTPTNTVTNTASDTATNIATNTVTNTSTTTATNTPTNTSTNTATAIATNTATNSATNTATSTATNTSTYTVTSTVTNSATNTATLIYTASNTVTNTATNSVTNTATNSPTVTISNTSTSTFTMTPTTVLTNTPTVTLTPTATQIVTGTTISVPYPDPITDSNSPIYFDYSATQPTLLRWSVFTVAFRKISGDTLLVNARGTVTWNLKDKNGQNVANGVYYLKANFVGTSVTRLSKILVVR